MSVHFCVIFLLMTLSLVVTFQVLRETSAKKLDNMYYPYSVHYSANMSMQTTREQTSYTYRQCSSSFLG